jgi:ABC-type multidrug transport system fused ATPase/permease subunit
LRDNLTMFGALPAEAADLTEALDAVGLGRWWRALPHGLDSAIEGPADLSAGEAQLLAFARVLLVDPGLVILDEASSRLDPATEARLSEATDRLLAGRTAVIIAHRLATLDRVDEILVLDHGQVVEHGRRAELALDSTSRYAQLVAAGTAGGLR